MNAPKYCENLLPQYPVVSNCAMKWQHFYVKKRFFYFLNKTQDCIKTIIKSIFLKMKCI